MSSSPKMLFLLIIFKKVVVFGAKRADLCGFRTPWRFCTCTYMTSDDRNLPLRSSVFILIGKVVLSVDCLTAWQVQGSLRDMGVKGLCVGTYTN